MYVFNPAKTSGPDGYFNFKFSGGGGGNNESGNLGCGGLIFIIILAIAFMSTFVSSLGNFACYIGLVIIIIAIVIFIKNN